MDTRRIPISISVNPTEYSGRNLRLGSAQSDIREKMNQRMREFEEESKKWREQFMTNSISSSSSAMSSSTNNNVSSIDHRPKMFLNFTEFPEIGSSSLMKPIDRAGSGFFASSSSPLTLQSANKSFIEEDNDGNKKYKVQFDIGDFKPHELKVKTEGRLLIITGDRELTAGSAMESKQFNREITLPDFIEPTSVTSFLTDGLLNIEAPVITDRLALNNNNTTTSTISNSSSSYNTLLPNATTTSILNSSSSFNNLLPSASRLSPFRDTPSPSRTLLSTSNFSNSSRSIRDDLLNNSNNNNNSTIINSFSSTPLFSDGSNTIGTVSNTAQNYKFNMSEFRPEDISITVTDTTLKIHAVREENEPKGVGKSYREFKREIGLPQGADVKRLKNTLQADGTLHIEIPVQEAIQNTKSITNTSSSSTFNKHFGDLSLHENSNNSLKNALNIKENENMVNERVNFGEKDLKITFDLNGYKPEDVHIKITDNTLKVHAVHIDNSRGNQIHREYSRSYVLPEWVNNELLRARMSDNGTLTVEIPLPQVQPSKLERVIKIH